MVCINEIFVPLILLVLALGTVAEVKEAHFGSNTDVFRSRYQHLEAYASRSRDTTFELGGRLPAPSNRRSLVEQGETDESSKLDSILSARKSTAAGVVELNPSASLTDETFSTLVCSSLNNTVTKLYVNVALGRYFALPLCLVNASSILTKIHLQGVIVHDFRDLPSSLVDLQIETSRIAPSLSGPVNGSGFDMDGNVAWDDLWTQFPLLTRLSLRDTQLVGELPTAFPSILNDITLSMNYLFGEIPSTLFTEVLSANPASLHFDVFSNQLQGNLNSTLFEPGSTAITSLYFNVAANNFYGPLASDILHPFAGRNLTSFTFSISGNWFFGELSEDFFPFNFLSASALPSASSSFDFRVASNKLVGTIPSTLFNFTGFSDFVFDASGNLFDGPLPSRLFSSNWKCTGTTGRFWIHLFGNFFNEAIPDTFLVSGLSNNATFSWIDLDFSGNNFEGAVPSGLLYGPSSGVSKRDGAVHIDSLLDTSVSSLSSSSAANSIVSLFSDTIGLNLGYNDFRGSLPNNLLTYSSFNGNITHLYLDISKSNISGQFPTDLLTNVKTYRNHPTVLVFASSTLLSGSPPASCWPASRSIYDFSQTSLNGTIPTSWQSCEFEKVDLSDNPSLTASMPPALFSKMTSFSAANTPLSGPIPTLSSATKFLDLTNTNINFCSSPSSTPSNNAQFTGQCMVYGSNACECGYLYAMCDNRCTPSELVIPPVTPITPPSPTSSCAANTRPSADFTCINGTWTAAFVSTPILVIPSGAGKVLVTGNLNSTSIVLKDIGSSIEITGSATNLTTVTIELTPSQVSGLGDGKVRQSLITVASGNNGTSSINDLNAVTVNTRVTSGCKKVKAQKALSNGGRTLGAVFSVDNSGCNRWWIILVAVVAGIVVLAVIVLVLLGIFYKPFRTKLRPYSEARERRTRTAYYG